MAPAPPGTTTDDDAPAPTARPPALSPSRLNDFTQCPLLFRFRSVDRLPEPAAPAAARGTLVHAVLERLFDAPPGERTPAAAKALVPGEWERLVAVDPRYAALPEAQDERWLVGAGTLLDTYFTLEDPNRLAPEARELRVETRLPGGPRLRGIVDRLDVAPDGAMRVVDYKTGRSPRPGYESGALFQMRFYALVLWLERGRIPRLLQLIYLRDGQLLRTEPREGELRIAEQRIRSLWGAISDAAHAGAWAPRRSGLCSWCAHQALCPEFGGRPPELPDGAALAALDVAP